MPDLRQSRTPRRCRTPGKAAPPGDVEPPAKPHPPGDAGPPAKPHPRRCRASGKAAPPAMPGLRQSRTPGDAGPPAKPHPPAMPDLRQSRTPGDAEPRSRWPSDRRREPKDPLAPHTPAKPHPPAMPNQAAPQRSRLFRARWVDRTAGRFVGAGLPHLRRREPRSRRGRSFLRDGLCGQRDQARAVRLLDLQRRGLPAAGPGRVDRRRPPAEHRPALRPRG